MDSRKFSKIKIPAVKAMEHLVKIMALRVKACPSLLPTSTRLCRLVKPGLGVIRRPLSGKPRTYPVISAHADNHTGWVSSSHGSTRTSFVISGSRWVSKSASR